METSLQIDIRWRDLDLLGHVNQSVYHELLEEGRAALIVDAGTQLAFVLARVELDYVKEVRRDHSPVTVTTRVVEVGNKKIVLESEVLRNSGELAARGTAVLVCWDPALRASRPLSGEERAKLEA